MMEDVDRLDGLINQLLDVARLQQKESDLRSADWIAIHDVILEIASKLQSQYHLPDDAIRMNIIPCEVLAHRVDIEVLVRNLLDNAVKYSSDPTEIEIEVKLEDEKIYLAVSDNGPGIPRHLRRKVFSRFYRVGDELERKKPGTGLGLFLVRSIVQRLRGTVRITDLMKKNGSRFLIVIPNGRVSCDMSRKNSTPPS
jgi:signal transduction histidine kinase